MVHPGNRLMALFRSFIAAAAVFLAIAPTYGQTVFVTDFYSNTIRRVNSQTGAAVVPPVGATALPPASLTYGPDGNMYSANQNLTLGGGPGSISRINPATGVVLSTITFSN